MEAEPYGDTDRDDGETLPDLPTPHSSAPLLPFTRADLVSNLVSITTAPPNHHLPDPPRRRPGSILSPTSASGHRAAVLPLTQSGFRSYACAVALEELAWKIAAMGRAGGRRGMTAVVGSCWISLPAWCGPLPALLLALLVAGEAGWERDRAGPTRSGADPSLRLSFERWGTGSPLLFPPLLGEGFNAIPTHAILGRALRCGSSWFVLPEVGLCLILRLLRGEFGWEEDLHPPEQNGAVCSSSECYTPDRLSVWVQLWRLEMLFGSDVSGQRGYNAAVLPESALPVFSSLFADFSNPIPVKLMCLF